MTDTPVDDRRSTPKNGGGNANSEWQVWMVRGIVGLFIMIAGWTANRVVTTLDKHSDALVHVQGAVDAISNVLPGINSELRDHEERLRQDRDVLVSHSSTLVSEAERILSLERTRQNDESRVLNNPSPILPPGRSGR